MVRMVSEILSWDDAREPNREGGHLATISSREEKSTCKTG